MKTSEKNVALVLSSGGARGMAHVGVIDELEKAGYTIRSIAGSSIGAVVGGIYATGNLNAFAEWVNNLHKFDVFRLMDFTLSTQGFIKGEKVFEEIRKFVEDRNIEDLDIPFAAIAADVFNRREVVLNKGSLFHAVRASIAIPTVLQPKKINGIELVDGGVVNPIPVEHVHRSRNDILVVVDMNSTFPYKKPQFDKAAQELNKNQYKKVFERLKKKFRYNHSHGKSSSPRLGYYELLQKSMNLMQEKLSEMILEKYQPDLLIRISRKACKTFEFYRSNEMIEAGKEAFHRAIRESNI